tara:strand:- start:1507 stop:2202 length:696 start_codon:yes stop_codon:yes gene_type:complete
MKVGVWQSNYIPWKGYFDYIDRVDIFCFYDEVKYTKNDWRNRNQIFGNDHPFWLTIPVDNKYTKLKISDVPIPNNKILLSHFKSIQQSYSRAPNKTQILNLIYNSYHPISPITLSELNHSLIKLICSYIGITTKFVNSKDYELKDTRMDRLIHLLDQLKTTTYASGLNAKNYIIGNESEFYNKNINLEWVEYGPYLKYKRNGNEFNDYISIIDLLMNVPQNELLDYIKPQK